MAKGCYECETLLSHYKVATEWHAEVMGNPRRSSEITLRYSNSARTVTRRTFLGGLILSTTARAEVSFPDPLIADAYRQAAELSVLAAINPRVFPGYFSVCADGHGFGYGNTYPSLDGHQMSDALLWLGQVEVVKANWEYVKGFQRADGCLPLAILPASAGQDIGPKGYPGVVEANGGLYVHWVPGNPLAALSSPTYIQNADVIFRRTLDRERLAAQIESVNRAADIMSNGRAGWGATGSHNRTLSMPSSAWRR